jgi:hypothetical protein
VLTSFIALAFSHQKGRTPLMELVSNATDDLESFRAIFEMLVVQCSVDVDAQSVACTTSNF